ncbi:Gfo/Idh/MocA family oxidoreductase [Algoriphagus aestuariicola]|uniref:Gfo/Idh/MocA family oxidoreductase n=1 Tax=Algoriphagus aestuariicola TaxID=1852016 RepID=A0ABS3BMT0_9BACT|nr:Gfo/Idh/MocA family oxidoreductase [Algoriphagus aestuariicola]MBN7800221.1 Gfo/Idh/MocA family oxidoreductase [Algoriphagus aestuariicola]
MKNQRREFLKKAGSTLALASVGTGLAGSASANTLLLKPGMKSQSNDKIRIGLIGAGIIGHYDTDAALTIDGVELAAACDLYTGRLEYAKEKWGKDLFTTRDYREVLAKPDIDAVLICTPDHWHQRIAIDAMKAGKHVYCEKPMVQRIEDGQAIVDTQKATGKVLQVGSQRASSIAVLEAKKVLQSGVIGDLTFVSAYCDRSDTMGAWNYSIPTDASPETVDFDTFLGYAPKVPFDAKRFFRWRNYSDYGTGAAGDLIVHLLTTVHTITDSKGPNKIFGAGDLKYWKDGRDAYDVINALMTYPKTEQHDSFQVTTRVNLCDGEGKGEFGLKLVGTNGVITIGWNDFTVSTLKRGNAPGYGGYDSYTSFSAEEKKDFQKWYTDTYGADMGGIAKGEPMRFEAPEDYDDRVDHLMVFFNGVRTGSPIPEDAEFGFRAAAPSLACNLSIAQEKPILWDPVGMKLL